MLHLSRRRFFILVVLCLDMLPLIRVHHDMVMCRVLLRNEMWLCLCRHLEMKRGYIQFSGGHGEFMPLLLEIVHLEFGMAISKEVLSPNLIMMIRAIKGSMTMLIHLCEYIACLVIEKMVFCSFGIICSFKSYSI